MLSIVGLRGRSICEVVIVSMATIADMAGLSPDISWTQRRPILMHRCSSNRSSGSLGRANVMSRSSMTLFCSHNPQTCKYRLANFRILYSISTWETRRTYMGKKLFSATVPLPTQGLQQDNSKAIYVTFQCHLPFSFILWSRISPL
jgi:hypothetical protein